jgi:multiple sugar transport system permease protein
MTEVGRVPTRRRRISGHRRHDRIVLAILICYSIVILFPLFWVVLTSFKNNLLALSIPPVWTFTPILSNYTNLPEDVPNFTKVFANSLITAAASTIGILVLAAPAGYGLSRFVFKRSQRLGVAVLATRTVPRIALALPLFLMARDLHLLDTLQSVIVANIAYTLPLAMLLVIGFVDAIPIELDEAATIDGCGRIRIFYHVVLPLIWPGLAALAILCSITAWNEFLMPFILTSRKAVTLPIVVAEFINGTGINWGELCAFAVVTMIPGVIAIVLVGRTLSRAFTSGAVTG